MKELQIERIIDNRKTTVTLTDDELEKAYRIMERRYLDEDFANALADAAQNPDTRFHSGHLEEFPELSDWLCAYFDDIYDGPLSLKHLHNASLKPQFFLSLSMAAPVVCMGIEKDISECEQICGRHHRYSNIAEADDRSRQWETLASILAMHQSGSCTCNKNHSDKECSAAKYLKGTWDISEFFHLEDRKEAAE